MVNYKDVTGRQRVPRCRTDDKTIVTTMYSVSRRHTGIFTKLCKTRICASCERLLTGGSVSTIDIYAPGCLRTPVSTTTLGTNGRMLYRGPVTASVRRTRSVVRTTDGGEGGLVVTRGRHFIPSRGGTGRLVTGNRTKGVCDFQATFNRNKPRK